MGLDASVRCRCFEEHRLRPGPVPYEDLYVDEEGYLCSMTLDRARERFGFRQYWARYEELDRAFREWTDQPCEHEWGAYCTEWVSNWAGVHQFEDLVKECGGEGEFPLLSGMMPEGNGGTYPAELAEATLEELDRFIERVTGVSEWVLRVEGTGEHVWSVTDGSAFTWMYSFNQRIGMAGGLVYFAGPGDSYVETAHFRQEPVGAPQANGSQRMRITCLDGAGETVAFDSVGPVGAPKEAREFRVVSMKAPFLYEGRYPTADRIRNLLVASVETGNPITWS